MRYFLSPFGTVRELIDDDSYCTSVDIGLNPRIRNGATLHTTGPTGEIILIPLKTNLQISSKLTYLWLMQFPKEPKSDMKLFSVGSV